MLADLQQDLAEQLYMILMIARKMLVLNKILYEYAKFLIICFIAISCYYVLDFLRVHFLGDRFEEYINIGISIIMFSILIYGYTSTMDNIKKLKKKKWIKNLVLVCLCIGLLVFLSCPFPHYYSQSILSRLWSLCSMLACALGLGFLIYESSRKNMK